MSRIAEALRERRTELLDQWNAELLTADSLRPDLLQEAELRNATGRFIEILATVLSTSGNKTQIRSPEFVPLLRFLDELSRARVKQGFTPSEIATFILSFKQPLFSVLRKLYGSDTQGLLKDTWTATVLLDKLGLYTTEVFQQSREELIRRQQEEMLELSTPVVRLWDGILALPLIGTLDSNRTSIVMESLLQTIVQTGSEIAIIDITGVPTVDTLVAQHLLKTVAAARLMGADCIISGIRPQIAQTMVHLQIDLSSVTTKATMAEALLVALRRSGYAVARDKALKQ
jgi:rsbT co-antagonist protein RsbR